MPRSRPTRSLVREDALVPAPPDDRSRLERLRHAGPGVVGGLVLERATAARGATAVRSERENAVWSGVVEGLEAAARGHQPSAAAEELPSWVLGAMRSRLRDHDFYWLDADFVDVRTIELLGLAELEVDDDYVLSMLTGLMASRSWEDGVWGDPVEWFRLDPELVERAYWRAYEIEGAGVVSLRVQPAGPRSTGWREITLTMIAEGMVARERVVEACFTALDRDFSPAASQWFVRLLGDLALTDEELAARQPAIRRHLSHVAPAATRNALAWLGRVERRGLLDDEATAPALVAAVLAPTKVAALAALRLLGTIHDRTPAADVVAPARLGLGHGHVDVQRAAATLLRACGREDVLQAEADQLGPALRAELGLLGPTRIPMPDPPAVHPGAGGPVSTGLPDRPSRRDVAERLAALLERADDPVEIELVLDALGEGGQTDLLAPLARRARQVLQANEYHRLEQQLAALVMASTGSRAWPSVPPHPWARFLHRRLDEVVRVLDGTDPPSPRLATPTETDGRLDPGVFVDRLLRTGADGHRVDLVAALLRLAPEGRAAALRAWGSASSATSPSLDQVVRHALGQDPQGPARLADGVALWVAASRARDPFADDPLLLDHGIDGPGRGRGLHAVVAYQRTEAGQRHFLDDEDHHLTVRYATGPTATPTVDLSPVGRLKARARSTPHVDQPTATSDVSSLSAFDDDLGWLDHAWASWNATTWPADAEHHAASVVVAAFQGRSWTVADPATRGVLATFRRHPGRLGPTVAATLALTTASATTETRVHAADAVVDLVSRRRLTSEQVGAALGASAPVVVISRWEDTLGRVSAAGRPDVATAVLTAALPAVPRAQRGVHALVDLLHQDLLRTGGRAGDPALRAWLAGFSGSGRAASSARGVLSL